MPRPTELKLSPEVETPDAMGLPAGYVPDAARTWVLGLSLDGGTLLRCWLTDMRAEFVVGTAPWPPVGALALPPDIIHALRNRQIARFRLQLPSEIDYWPWELELLRAGLTDCALPRYLTDAAVNATAATADTPSRLVVPVGSTTVAHLPLVARAQQASRPLVAVSTQVTRAQITQLEALLRNHWRAPLWFSHALARSLRLLELAPTCCRLYGDELGPVDDAEEAWRPVTALSIDVVDSTPLVRSAKGERYGRTMQAYYRHCREITEHFHGTLEMPRSDDGMVAYFGFPRAVEGAASRALMAAWRLCTSLEQLGLKVRIGVASGEVAVNARLAYGADVHLAVRARALADPGQIVVAPSTVARAGPEFQLVEHRKDVQLKGFSTTTTLYRLTAVAAHRSSTQTSGARLVGRERELQALCALLDDVSAAARRWCTVRGEAGVGKSRLLAEFTSLIRSRGIHALRVSGYPHGERTPFGAIIDLLREHWSIRADSSPDSVQQAVAATIPAPDSEAITQLLAVLMHSAPVKPGAEQHVGTTLLECLHAIIAQRPCCLIVDDAHWIDPSSIELLSKLRRQDGPQPKLVVFGERTGVASRLPLSDAEVSAGLVAEVIELRGLPDTAMRELAGELGGAPSRELQDIIERAAGVPLFLEESLRLLRQRGIGAINEIPATLEDLLVSRLDELGLDRALAQLLSVFGRECRADHVARLLQIDDPFIQAARQRGSLDCLLETGFLQATDGAQPGYRFRHALIRDAAYRSLPTRERERLHSHIVSLLEQASPEISRERPEWMATHLEAAGRRHEAREAWFAAARAAASRQAYREAAELGERALTLAADIPAPLDRARFATRTQQLVAAALVALHGYGSPAVEQAYRRAEAHALEQGDLTVLTRVRLGLEACFVMRGDLRRADQLARDAVSHTDWRRDPLLALQARWALANVQFHRGQWRAALAGFDDCLKHYHQVELRLSAVQDPAVMCMGYSSWVLLEIGRGNDALERIEHLLAHARALGHPFSLAVALGFAASIKRWCGEPAAAREHAEEAVAICERGEFDVWLSHGLMVRGQLLADSGATEAGAADMDRGYALWWNGGARVSCATYLVTRAEIQLRAGDTTTAGALLAEAEAVSRSIRERYYHAELRRLRGLYAWQLGDRHAAGHALEAAMRLATRHAKPGLALRCGLSLGAWHAAHGRFALAARLIENALQALGKHDRCRDYRWAQLARTAWSERRLFTSQPHTPWEPS